LRPTAKVEHHLFIGDHDGIRLPDDLAQIRNVSIANVADVPTVSQTGAIVAFIPSKIFIAHIQGKLVNAGFGNFFAIAGIRFDFAWMHEAVGKEHRGKHIPGIAQVKNDLCRIQSSAGHKEAEWPEASISLRNEIFASEDLLERQLFVGCLVRGKIGDMVLLANVAKIQ
jgi:hypothetical protein